MFSEEPLQDLKWRLQFYIYWLFNYWLALYTCKYNTRSFSPISSKSFFCVARMNDDLCSELLDAIRSKNDIYDFIDKHSDQG